MDLEERMNEQEISEKIAQYKKSCGSIREEVSKMIVGQRDIIDGVIVCILAGGNVLLEGVPGLGKTMLVRSLATVLGLDFSRIQFTPDLMPTDILGTTMLVESEDGSRAFTFEKGPIFSNMILADEINRATPKTQSAMLEAMQEKSVTIGKQTYKLEQPFFVLATQNPLEQEGTYPLPEAQLDRFLYKLYMKMPSLDEMHVIMDRTTSTEVPDLKRVIDKETLLEIRDFARGIPVAPHIQDYALRLMYGTHPGHELAPDDTNQYVRFGASPRGAQTLLLTAKIRALMDGRRNVSADDIRASATPALRHRVILNFEGEAEGVSTDEIIDEIIRRTPETKKK